MRFVLLHTSETAVDFLGESLPFDEFYSVSDIKVRARKWFGLVEDASLFHE